MKYIKESVQFIKAHGLYPNIRVIQSAHTPEAIVDGKKVLLFASNSYLGLTVHPEVKEAAIKAIEKYGTGSGNSRLLSGNLDIHREAELAVANFKGEEDAILFPAGFMANIGTIPALMNVFNIEGKEVDKGVIFSDELNHACIILGAKLSGAEKVIYKHRDMNDLESKLAVYPNRRKLIVSDGIFSLDGDIAPFDKMTELAKKYNSMIMLDDAHATGVLGESGHGTADFFKIEGKLDVIMGTFSKALATMGGFICGEKDLIDYLRISAKSYLFTAGMAPSVSATVIAAINVIKKDPSIRKRLLENTKLFRDGLNSIGYNTGDSQTPIVPIILGDEVKAIKVAELFYENGIFGPAVRWPAVPKGTARIRFTVSALHEKNHIDTFLSVAEKILKKSQKM